MVSKELRKLIEELEKKAKEEKVNVHISLTEKDRKLVLMKHE